MENRQFEAMLSVAQERLAQHAPEDIAGKAGAQYADGSFSLKTLGQTVTVRLSDCTIQPPLSKWHALTLLHYLDLADGAPLTGRTITFSQYKDGLVRGGGLDRNAELIVRRDLGILPPEDLERRCRSLGAELLPSNADFCARFDFIENTWADRDCPAVGLHDSAAAFQVARADTAALSGSGRRCAADRSDDHIFSI